MTCPQRTLAAALLFALAAPAFPQAGTGYIVHAPEAGVPRIAADTGLTLLRSLDTQGTAHLLAGPGAPSISVLTTLELDAIATGGFAELDTRSPEAEADAGARMAPVLDALPNSAADRSPVSYFGGVVRAGYVNQPASSIIRLPDAQALCCTGAAVVAIIDTGVDPNHPALKNSLVPGYDFVHDTPGIASELSDLSQSTVAILDQSTVAILDSKQYPVVLNQSTVAILDQSTVAILDTNGLPAAFGHGTMVAGLVHLVAPTARIMPLKAFRSDGSAMLSDIIRAIYFAVDNGAKVINMSFSQTVYSPELDQAVQYARAHGVICVAAAGNLGTRVKTYPASNLYVLGVGSTNARDHRSPFSNFGDGCARLAAPGEALITTYPGGNYAGVWGTSFSAALVSGAAALLVQRVPRISYGDAADAFEHGPQIDQGMGDARLDLFAALSAVSKN